MLCLAPPTWQGRHGRNHRWDRAVQHPEVPDRRKGGDFDGPENHWRDGPPGDDICVVSGAPVSGRRGGLSASALGATLVAVELGQVDIV
jgi:hypothetical protein